MTRRYTNHHRENVSDASTGLLAQHALSDIDDIEQQVFGRTIRNPHVRRQEAEWLSSVDFWDRFGGETVRIQGRPAA